MSLIVIDTQILIWAVKREATPGQEPMIEKAARYLEHLDKCKDQGTSGNYFSGLD